MKSQTLRGSLAKTIQKIVSPSPSMVVGADSTISSMCSLSPSSTTRTLPPLGQLGWGEWSRYMVSSLSDDALGEPRLIGGEHIGDLEVGIPVDLGAVCLGERYLNVRICFRKALRARGLRNAMLYACSHFLVPVGVMDVRHSALQGACLIQNKQYTKNSVLSSSAPGWNFSHYMSSIRCGYFIASLKRYLTTASNPDASKTVCLLPAHE